LTNFGVMGGQVAAGTLIPDGRTVEHELPSKQPPAMRVMLADGGVFTYDYLIVAAGSQTSY